MTNEHTSLEKYTFHTLFEMIAKSLRKGNAWEVWLGFFVLGYLKPF